MRSSSVCECHFTSAPQQTNIARTLMKKRSAPLLPVSMLLACITTGEPALAATHQPNIVIVYADDIGYGDFGCYGGTGAPTPNIDRLAASGLRLTSAYASSATCTPSRYSLLTGEYAFRKPGTGILPGDAAMIIEPGRATLPSLLQKAGYRTAAIGKWHLGLGTANQKLDWNGDIKPSPLDIGFDYSFIMAATGDRVPCVFVENRRVVGLDQGDPIEVDYANPFPGEPTGVSIRETLKMDWSHGHNMAVVNGIGRIGYMKGGKAALWKDEDMADTFTARAIQFIEREKQKPFFVYLALHDVHVPRIPHPRFIGKSSMGPRGDALVQFDACIGAVRSKLDALNLLDNTLLIITSDNGPVLDDGYKDFANEKLGSHKPAGPFRGGKYSLLEAGTRMPCIVHWPARVKPGVSHAMISQVDFPISLAAIAGLKTRPSTMPDSQDQSNALLGRDSKGRDHVLQHASGRVALRRGDWKFIPPGRIQEQLGPWSRFEIPEPGWLFNLAKDPGETTNVAAENPDVLKSMRTQLDALDGNNIAPGKARKKKS